MSGWILILAMLALGAGFGAASVALSQFVGPRHPTPEKSAPYECGMPAVGDARERQSVKFYLVAMVFLLFDIEVAFLYPWAVSLRDLGWTGLVQIVAFFLFWWLATSTSGAKGFSIGDPRAAARRSRQE